MKTALKLPSIKIDWGKDYGTAQIYSNGIEEALCSDDGRKVGPMVFCKDFFQDAVRAFLHQTSTGIHGYRYDYKTDPPISMDKIRIILANSGDPDLEAKIPGAVDFLNQIENQMGLEPSIAYRIEGAPDKYKSGAYLFEGDRVWLTAAPSLSAYTLLLRNSIQHRPGENWEKTLKAIIDGSLTPAQRNDNIYLKWGEPGLRLMMENGILGVFGNDPKKNWPPEKDVPTGTMHHGCGLVSFAAGKPKQYFPHWQYPEMKGTPPSICFA